MFLRKRRRRLQESEAALASEQEALRADQLEQRARVRLLDSRADELDSREEELARRESVLRTLVEDRVAAYELVAQAWADFELLRSETLALHLRRKKRPALVAAKEVRSIGRELAAARRAQKMAEYVVLLYEHHVPWIVDLRDLDAELDYTTQSDADRSADPVAGFMTADEYQQLTPADRNQRALERYLRSRLSPWQLGRDYERFVGYLREKDGFRVTYQGIAKGFEDLGRDLIAERDNTVEVIQCKRWARHKTIHEKHIFQLFGTVTAARIENPARAVTGTFVTTTTLSERAHAFADALEVRVIEGFPLDDYPRIKCNISRRSGDRIYHLPMDQQYDAVTIEPGRGECYAMTAHEAESAGFRRAWRWRGDG